MQKINKHVVILAAGKGTRMKSRDENHSKVSFPIIGKPLLEYVLDAVEPLDIAKKVVVVGFGGEVTSEIVGDRAEIVWQKETLGTGHAVLQAAPVLANEDGVTIVLCGDTPLLTTETIEALLHKHIKSKASATVLTAVLERPEGYGRIIREHKSNYVKAIRESKDCSPEEALISEINAGVYAFDNKLLFKYLKEVKPNNKQKEYYLTDVIQMLVDDGHKVEAYVVEDSEEIFGINDRYQLSFAARVMKKRINHRLMLSGVSMEDPDTTYISPDVEIGPDTILMPNVYILGKGKVGEGNYIGPNTTMINVEVGNNNNIISSYITDTKIGNNNELGPYLKSRGGTVITDHCRVGNFVELKNAYFCPGVKCAHLTYIGDAEVGESTNIGCMTVTANYDGYNKSRTEIGKNVFIGSGTILIAPVKVYDHAFTAAGSVITEDVHEDDLAIARARQVVIPHGASYVLLRAKAKKEGK